jgi:hypothetical protein
LLLGEEKKGITVSVEHGGLHGVRIEQLDLAGEAHEASELQGVRRCECWVAK